MKTVVIDGVEYEEISRWSEYGNACVKYAPLPPKQKTIVQVAAERFGGPEVDYRKTGSFPTIAAFDYIEQRLQAIERKLEGA